MLTKIFFHSLILALSLCLVPQTQAARFVCEASDLAKLSIDMDTPADAPPVGRRTPVAGTYRVEGRFEIDRLTLLPFDDGTTGPASLRIRRENDAPPLAHASVFPTSHYLTERNVGGAGEYDPQLLIFLRILDEQGIPTLELEFFGSDHPENRFHILARDDIGPTRLVSSRIECSRADK